MRRLIALFIIIAIVSSFTGCFSHFDAEKALETFDRAVSLLGRTQLTDSLSLIGKRSFNGSDRYTGSYYADCSCKSGRDVIFGGASIKDCKIELKAHIDSKKGTAVVRIRIGTDVREYYPDENGDIALTLDFEAGGDYIMVDYEDFHGQVELYSEYID